MVVVFVRLLRDEEVVVATVVFGFFDLRLVVVSAIWTVVISAVVLSGIAVLSSLTTLDVAAKGLILSVSTLLVSLLFVDGVSVTSGSVPDVLGVSVELERSNCSIETVLSTISVVT